MATVNELYPLEHLVGKHEHCLETEFALAVVEKVFEGRAQKIDYHHIVVSLNAEPVDIGDADAPLQNAVQLGLIEQLRMLSPYGL